MNRQYYELYPDLTAFISEIDRNGITPEILNKILTQHESNALYNKELYDRYQVLDIGVPIFQREPRFEGEENAINNKVANDFFSEIVDIKTGYFAGKPIGYSYSASQEAVEDTGGDIAREIAQRALTDFTTRNNMYDIDMEITKFAAICGYAGRLLYIDAEGNERVMVSPPYETVILSRKRDITEPDYAIRYFKCEDTNGNPFWLAEFYDDKNVTYFKGDSFNTMELDPERPAKPHMFDYCPLQGIPNNAELMGDAEKVLSLIDAYDRVISDNSNEIESFANAHIVWENVNIEDDEIKKAQKSGSIHFWNGSGEGKIYYLTKPTTGDFSENHLNRLEDNIYRFSKTPNLGDESFGTASGVSLKFKITGLETKCGMFQAKMQSAGNYMFKVLSSSLAKRRVALDPLQCIMTFKRNFPLDLLSEAQSASALIGAGLPKRAAFAELSFVDDVEEIMQMIEEEKDGIPDLDEDTPLDEPEVQEHDGMNEQKDNTEEIG